jgi:hypothetical protein
MGLHNTAHYLKSKGRGDDTELVHMTKNEVQALKGLAAAHGGQLTTNPETGLTEAGFLGSVLPMVAGVAAAAFAPELLPLIAGGIGVADYAMTGSITKGLMAGLSAYGAGGLGEAFQTAGDVTAAAEGGANAVQNAAVQSGTQLAAGTAEPGVEAALSSQQIQALNAINPTNMANMSTDQLAQLRMDALNAQNPMDVVNSAGMGNVAQSSAVTNPTGMQALSSMGRGITSAGGSVLGSNLGNLAMAASPLLMDTLGQRPTLPGTPSTGSSNPFGLATMSPNFQPSRPTTPNPYYVAQYPDYKRNPYQPGIASPKYPSESGSYPGGYTPVVNAAEGGLMQGGPAQVDFMGGDMYPQSQIQRSYYATPTQMPTSAQQTAASYEPKTNPLTGELTANMREGGIASYSGKYGSVVAIQNAMDDLEEGYGYAAPKKLTHADPGIYQDTDPNTRNLSPYEAALYRVKSKAKAAGMDKDAVVLPKQALQMGDIQDTDYAGGGIAGASTLGGYAAGGNPRLLKGPGDGMSDSIPANIGGKQPARLADGEFVVPADVVSHLGNGSTDAGAKKLYSMMDNIRKARTGRKKQAPAVKPEKYLPK